MTTNDIQYIRNVLRQMQKADPGFRVFGACNHNYRLGPSLSEEYLAKFEQQHQVALPTDYRLFLKNVGNGSASRSSSGVIAENSGAGPDYGLLSLEETCADCVLTQPFPFLPSQLGQPVQGKEEWGDTEPYPGILGISFKGCAFRTCLVVKGPAYGTVWDADDDSVQFYPTGLSFWEWYRCWLDKLIDRALPLLANERVVEQVSIGMTKAQVIHICGGQGPVKDFGHGLKFLKFEHLATDFQLDENEYVIRIVRHHISLGMSRSSSIRSLSTGNQP